MGFGAPPGRSARGNAYAAIRSLMIFAFFPGTQPAAAGAAFSRQPRRPRGLA